jgi:hypothetical protein
MPIDITGQGCQEGSTDTARLHQDVRGSGLGRCNLVFPEFQRL